MNALNPELVVFGGILSLAGEFLMTVIEKEVDQRALKWNRRAMQLVLAKHGSDACVMGGVATVYQAILAHPDIVGAFIARVIFFFFVPHWMDATMKPETRGVY